VTAREEQIARNEALFRKLNERVQEIVTTIEHEPYALEVFCECGSASCVAKITLLRDEYEGIRAHPERFIVAPGHDTSEVERVVEKRSGSWIVQKEEEAAQIARESDPRS
jgi:hypothetical protein